MLFTPRQEEAVVDTFYWQRCFAAQLWLILYSYIYISCYLIAAKEKNPFENTVKNTTMQFYLAFLASFCLMVCCSYSHEYVAKSYMMSRCFLYFSTATSELNRRNTFNLFTVQMHKHRHESLGQDYFISFLP